MHISKDFGKTWTKIKGNKKNKIKGNKKNKIKGNKKKTVLVISPGATTYYNRKAYNYLKKYYSVVFVDTTTREEGFRYPQNWRRNDQLVLGKNDKDGLKGLANSVGEQILENTPDIIVCGSRGSQVTIGLVWKHYWRGPTVCINAGPLTSHTKIYKEVQPLMVTMEHDYFKTQDETQEKYHAVEAEVDGLHVHLLGKHHLTKFKSKFFKIIIDASLDHDKIKSVDGTYLVTKLTTKSNCQIVTVRSRNVVTYLRKFPNSNQDNWTSEVKNTEKVSIVGYGTDEKGYAMFKVQPQQNKQPGWIYVLNILEFQEGEDEEYEDEEDSE